MKLIKKTRKYVYVRMTEAQYKKAKRDHDRIENMIAMNKAFREQYEEVRWQDEYSSWHTYWKNKKTGDVVYHKPFGA